MLVEGGWLDEVVFPLVWFWLAVAARALRRGSTADNQLSSIFRSPSCAQFHGACVSMWLPVVFVATHVLFFAELVIPKARIFRRPLLHQPRNEVSEWHKFAFL